MKRQGKSEFHDRAWLRAGWRLLVDARLVYANNKESYRKKKMKHLSEDDFTLIEELTKQIMTKTLHNPIVNLKRQHRCSDHEKEEREHLHRQTKFIEEIFVEK